MSGEETSFCNYFGRVHNIYGHNPVKAVFRRVHDAVDCKNQYVVSTFDPLSTSLNVTFALSLPCDSTVLI